MNLLLTYAIDALAIFLLTGIIRIDVEVFALKLSEALPLAARIFLSLTAPLLSLGLAATIGLFVSFIQAIVR